MQNGIFYINARWLKNSFVVFYHGVEIKRHTYNYTYYQYNNSKNSKDTYLGEIENGENNQANTNYQCSKTDQLSERL